MHDDMAVQSEHLVEQLLAEAVHHRHHDDERGDAKHDADEGETGDDRDEALLAARPQVAQRHHPLEGGEGSRSRSALMRLPCSFRSRIEPGDLRRIYGKTMAGAGCALLQLHLARGNALRPDDDLPGRPIRSMAANLAPARSSRSS